VREVKKSRAIILKNECTIRIRTNLRITLHNAVARERGRVFDLLQKIEDYGSREYQDLYNYKARIFSLEQDSIVLCPFCNEIGKDMVFLMPEHTRPYWLCVDCNQKINKKV